MGYSTTGPERAQEEPALKNIEKNRAEGKGLEPSTGCPASDFESDSSPFGYPPGESRGGVTIVAVFGPRSKVQIAFRGSLD